MLFLEGAGASWKLTPPACVFSDRGDNARVALVRRRFASSPRLLRLRIEEPGGQRLALDGEGPILDLFGPLRAARGERLLLPLGQRASQAPHEEPAEHRVDALFPTL